jgi:hypothetical protein
MRALSVLLLFGLPVLALVAQERVAFDIASIKPNASASAALNNRFSPGRMVLINHPPTVLIQQAYGVTSDRLIGVPDWASRERFDIEATYTPPNAPYAERMRMLQTLLAERFALRVHGETRELPIYALVRARQDGPLGPGLRVSSRDCAPRKGRRRRRDSQCRVRVRHCVGFDPWLRDMGVSQPAGPDGDSRPSRSGSDGTLWASRDRPAVAAGIGGRRGRRSGVDLHGASRAAWPAAGAHHSATGRAGDRQHRPPDAELACA